jgi:KipI family sensor histidine kinase inhibitor
MEIIASSDRALLVRPGDHGRVIALAQALEQSVLKGVTSYSPGYDSVLVRYDPCVTDGESLERSLAELTAHDSGSGARQPEVALPVTFDGPDLEELAKSRGLDQAEVIRIFCATKYRVYFLGFVPGFAYMGDVDERIAAPRRAVPRMSVPVGSVGIAGRQTGVYPSQTPGGWNLIGRCAIPMFIAERNPPCLLKPGDRVVFRPA